MKRTGSRFSAEAQQQLLGEFKHELNQILDWWAINMIDSKNGGFFGKMDGHGKLHPEADKGAILNSRILWAFSTGANATGKPLYRDMADYAFAYFNEYFWDELEGGVFWSLDYQGNPANTQKQIYAQAFAIYALSEYYALSKNMEALNKATELFWLIEKYSLDNEYGGYFNAFARDWSAMDDIRLSEKDENAAKIMNTHLHILEAYTNFFKVMPYAALKDALSNIILLYLDKFYIPENGSMHIYFDEKWIAQGHDISFGHNIEASWLLWEAAEALNEYEIAKKVQPVSIHMARAVMAQAIDTDGGIFYEASPQGIKDSDKHWWPQTEAVVGFWNAYQLSGELPFAEACSNCWSFIKKYLLDTAHGEWHWRTDQKGTPVLSEDKAGPWKAPYHNSRMCIEMMRRLSE